MKNLGSWRQAAWFLIFILLVSTTPASGGPFSSLTIEKEKQIGEEFFLEIQQHYSLATDPFVTSYINRLGRRLVAQLGPQPYNYRFFIMDDPAINAMAVPGGYIFVTTGFIRSMEREGELAGVLAHEVSHIYARHIARQMDQSRGISIVSLVGSLAAVLLGGPAAAAILAGTQAAGMSAMLKYSRNHEEEADSLGFKWMCKAGYNPREMMSMFRKLNKQRWFQGGELPIYLSTHPHTDDRLVEMAHHISQYKGNLPQKTDSPEFHYFALKVASIYGKPFQLLRRMTQASVREPHDPLYHYGKALALGKLERETEALEALKRALELDPENAIVQRELAGCYFENNRYEQALPILIRLRQRHPQDEVTLYYLGRIFQERHQNDQALAAMERVQSLNPAFVEVYHDLGTLYGEQGRLGLAHYYLGLHSLRARAYPTALFHFKKAQANMPVSDPHYPDLRSQITRLEKMKVKYE
jgi:beta-barrel assembly-enhancing protease